jgi:hypothetical protein
MVDHSQMKLGKRARRDDRRTLKLARYMTAALPSPPPSVDWTRGVTDFGMMLNDRLGCCTIAAVGHAVQTWTLNALGRELTVPDSTILNYYEVWDGYNPADPGSDQGGVELDVLNDWRQEAFNGHSLDAYVSLSPDHPIPDIATAIWLFGGAYIGLELPISAQNQDVWTCRKIPVPMTSREAGAAMRSTSSAMTPPRAPSPESRAPGHCLLPTADCLLLPALPGARPKR